MGIVAIRNIILKDGMEAVIRTGLPQDGASVLALARQVAGESGFLISYPEEFSQSVEQEQAWITAHLEQPSSLFLVGEIEGKLVGMLNFLVRPRRKIAHHGTLGMSVVQQWQGQGLGRGLLQTLVEWANSTPAVEKLCLEVFSNNHKALSLYQGFGFQEEGRRSKHIKTETGEYIDLILMGLWLKKGQRLPL